MTETVQQPKKKRRRRRRRKHGQSPADQPVANAKALMSEVAAEQQRRLEAEPAVSSPRSSGEVTCNLPMRYIPVLDWIAAANGVSVSQIAERILINGIAPHMPSYREATSGVLSSSAKAGAAADRLIKALPGVGQE